MSGRAGRQPVNASHPNGYRPSRSIGLRNLGHVLGSSIPHTYLRAKALSRAQCHTHTHAALSARSGFSSGDSGADLEER